MLSNRHDDGPRVPSARRVVLLGFDPDATQLYDSFVASAAEEPDTEVATESNALWISRPAGTMRVVLASGGRRDSLGAAARVLCENGAPDTAVVVDAAGFAYMRGPDRERLHHVLELARELGTQSAFGVVRVPSPRELGMGRRGRELLRSLLEQHRFGAATETFVTFTFGYRIGDALNALDGSAPPALYAQKKHFSLHIESTEIIAGPPEGLRVRGVVSTGEAIFGKRVHFPQSGEVGEIENVKRLGSVVPRVELDISVAGARSASRAHILAEQGMYATSSLLLAQVFNPHAIDGAVLLQEGPVHVSVGGIAATGAIHPDRFLSRRASVQRGLGAPGTTGVCIELDQPITTAPEAYIRISQNSEDYDGQVQTCSQGDQ